jgi:GTP-binding protein
MKKVVILGRPNVGKSSLFNRLVRERDAITSDISGTTRDIKKRIVTISTNREFEIIDTGGIDDNNELFSIVKTQSLKAGKDADIIIYMVDGKKIPDEEDKELFYKLQSQGKPIALVVNKIDNKIEEDTRFWDFLEFGAKTILPISVSHNRSMNDFYKWLEKYIPIKREKKEDNKEDREREDFQDDKEIRVAIIGRVNTGKSSLLNAILKKDRVVVSSVAGTTIDPIDEMIEYNEHKITFIDTAGIRRRGKIIGIEKYALGRTTNILNNANIVVLLIDATVGVTELDERVAGLIEKHRLACLIVINKWDIKGDKSYKEIIDDTRYALKFLHYAPIITVSAKSGQRVYKILDEIIKIYNRYKQRITTSKLNDIIKKAQERHHIPSYNGAVVKIKFATQYQTKPPKIALICNRPDGLHFSYKRYLANVLREQFDFKGVPLDITTRKRGERFEEE